MMEFPACTRSRVSLEKTSRCHAHCRVCRMTRAVVTSPAALSGCSRKHSPTWHTSMQGVLLPRISGKPPGHGVSSREEECPPPIVQSHEYVRVGSFWAWEATLLAWPLLRLVQRGSEV